jgi:wyosine [tRNA(Phe)-imidazoG37] synthetase (radical SAM superfamily)
LDEVIAELKDKLSTKPDYITLSGSGEPTLYSRLAELIDRIRSLTNVPVAVLTNGSLLWQEEVRCQIMEAHLIIPSLDAGDNTMFQAVNRPHESISFEQMVDGLITLREGYRGKYWLEVFLLDGYTAFRNEVSKIAKCVARIKPDLVQLNTATRPTAEDYAVMVNSAKMVDLAGWFDPPAEVVADYQGVHAQKDFQAGRDSILEMIQRRPCSLEDIAEGLGMHRNEVIKYIEELEAGGFLEKTSSGGKLFYSGIHQHEEDRK